MSSAIGDQVGVPCAIIRSGTSKGVFLRFADVPADEERRDAFVAALFGSPDPRQIDGLGGGDLLTSKAAIIGPSSRPDADVDYLFAQVDVTTRRVDWSGNCGNISAGVGPFAIDEGLVEVTEPVTTVRIHNVNTEKILIARVPVVDGRAATAGTTRIDGVPGSGAGIELDFAGSVGAATGELLPLGAAAAPVEVDGAPLSVTLVDAGNLTAFVRAADLGVGAALTWAEMADPALLARVEAIRAAVAVASGIAPSPEWFAELPRLLPQLALVGEPEAFASESDGRALAAEEVDFLARLFVIGTFHRAFPLTGLTAASIAARLPGSVVRDRIEPARRKAPEVRVGHPCGVVSARVRVDDSAAPPTVQEVVVERTARRLMDGTAFVPAAFAEEAT